MLSFSLPNLPSLASLVLLLGTTYTNVISAFPLINRQLKDVQQPEPVPEVVVVVPPLELEITFCNFTPMIHQVYKWDLPLF